MALAAAIQDRHGKLDVLINNAGIMEHVDLLDETVSDDRIANEIAVNLTGPILLTRRLLPLLRAGRDPLIVMISSGYALLPATRAPIYSASKAGLHSFAMALRRQLAGVGIRVVEVLPPLVDTPATSAARGTKMSADALVGRALSDIAKGRDESLPGKVGLLPIMMRHWRLRTSRAGSRRHDVPGIRRDSRVRQRADQGAGTLPGFASGPGTRVGIDRRCDGARYGYKPSSLSPG